MSESSFIIFNPERITEVASDIQNMHSELMQYISAIRQATSSLRHNWSSDSRAENYYNRASDLDARGDELSRIIRTFCDNLNQASGLYKTGESDVKQGVQQLPTEGVFRT
jgi:uncharacterized protein YukE